MTLYRAHALTAAELALLRTRVPAQRTDIYLAIWPMFEGVKGDPFNAIVWTALVDEPGGTVDDRLYEIDYDNGSGAADWANTLPDMTVYVGTTAGADDLGRARLRGWAAGAGGVAGTMLLAEMSEIVWQDDAYLTVIDDFSLWPRHIYIDSSGVIYMDRGYYDEVAAANVDGSYTDQHLYPDPVPVLGPDAIEWLPSSGNVRVYFDASNSFTLDGGALTYSWTFPGSVANGGLNVAATWAEYNAAGAYRADCQISRNYGAAISAFTGHRRIWVYDADNMPSVKFTLQDCAGDFSSGGWSYRVQMWDEATRSEIVDRARCVLFARDWFNGTEQSIGPLYTDQHGGMTLRENIICNGWIAGESIVWDNEKGNVTFDVEGPKYWFDAMVGFPHGIENSDGVPTGWFEYQNLMVRDGLWSFLHWRTTATRMMDIELTADTREIAVFSTPIGSLWDQLVAGSFPAILAPPVCDRYGCLIVEIPINHEFTASRAGTPTVLDMQLSDWRDQIDITRRIVSSRSMTDLSGVYYVDANNADAFFSLSYGHIFGRYGKIARQERLALFAAQATNNSLCGLVQADAVKEYPAVDFRLSGNYRVFDIVPRQRVTQTITAGNTERGIEWSTKRLLPRSVSFTMQDGLLLVDMTCEEETGEVNSTDGEPPATTPSPPALPPLPPLPPVEPPTPPVVEGVAVMAYDQMAISFDFFDGGAPTWYNFDPLGNLVGDFQNIAITSDGKAYCTTRDNANEANTGLWYCADITAAATGNNTWALIKSAIDACGDTGYIAGGANACCFGSLYVNQSNQVCALVHSVGNTVPPAPGSGAYIGIDGVVAISLFGAAGVGFFFQQQPFDRTMHSVYGGAGSWYIAGRDQPLRGYLAVGPAWAFTDFFTIPGEIQSCAAHGDVGGYVVGQSNQVYSGWNPAAPVAGLTVARAQGIYEDLAGAHYIYCDTASNDLYQDGVLIGDATSAVTGFGAGASGTHGMFRQASSTEIVWLLGNSRPFATHRVVIYSDDNGATWSDMTSNLQAALGAPANWSGWNGSSTGNCIIRTFSY